MIVDDKEGDGDPVTVIVSTVSMVFMGTLASDIVSVVASIVVVVVVVFDGDASCVNIDPMVSIDGSISEGMMTETAFSNGVIDSAQGLELTTDLCMDDGGVDSDDTVEAIVSIVAASVIVVVVAVVVVVVVAAAASSCIFSFVVGWWLVVVSVGPKISSTN